MMEAFNEFGPVLRDLVSARRSPAAGSSDIVKPNPIDKVSDTAPQSSDAAPGPSSASLEPRASGSGLHSDLHMTSSPLHVVIWTRETNILRFAMLRHRLPLHIKNDFERR